MVEGPQVYLIRYKRMFRERLKRNIIWADSTIDQLKWRQ